VVPTFGDEGSGGLMGSSNSFLISNSAEVFSCVLAAFNGLFHKFVSELLR
jgi:hypothetical protein